MLAAERHCKHLGTDPWSAKLKQARLQVEIMKLALSMITTGFDFCQCIDSLLAQHVNQVDIPNEVQHIKQILPQSQAAVRLILREAAAHRQEFLAQQVTEAQFSRDPIRCKAFKEIAQAEALKALYRKLRFLKNTGQQHSSLNRLEVPSQPHQDPKTCKEWMVADSPEEITSYLLERNRKHFGQAHGMPFTVPPLSIQIDFQANTEACEMILDGTYMSTEVNELTTLVIAHLERLTPSDALPSTISSKSMMAKYKACPERTSTSPSGRHLAHYRSLLPGKQPVPDDNKSQYQESLKQDLVMMHHSVLAYSLQHTFLQPLEESG